MTPNFTNNNPYVFVDPDGQDARDDQIERELARTRERVCGGGAYCQTSSVVPDYKTVEGQVSGISRALSNNGQLDGAVNTTELAVFVLGFVAGPTGNTSQLVTVGRWMSAAEHELMMKTGRVVESFSGTTHVALPSDIGAFIKQASLGSRYVTFAVPATALKVTSQGWAKIIGPSSLEARLAAKKGLPIPQMPSASDIAWIASKIR